LEDDYLEKIINDEKFNFNNFLICLQKILESYNYIGIEKFLKLIEDNEKNLKFDLKINNNININNQNNNNINQNNNNNSSTIDFNKILPKNFNINFDSIKTLKEKKGKLFL
jgi:hypothetical protein